MELPTTVKMVISYKQIWNDHHMHLIDLRLSIFRSYSTYPQVLHCLRFESFTFLMTQYRDIHYTIFYQEMNFTTRIWTKDNVALARCALEFNFNSIEEYYFRHAFLDSCACACTIIVIKLTEIRNTESLRTLTQFSFIFYQGPT